MNTRCKIFDKKILTRILGLSLWVFVFSFSQDAQEIIAKIEANQAKIIDLEAEVEIETSIQGKGEPLVQTMRIWQAKDEKGNAITRTEFMMQDTGYTIQDKKVIMIMTKDSVFSKKGNAVSRLPMKSQLNPEGKGPQVGTDFSKDAKSVKVLKQEGSTTVLEMVPNETEGIKIFDKAEETVDTEKGVITNQKLFTPRGVIKSEMEYRSIGEGEKKILVLKEMKTITQYGLTVMRYKNVKVNKGIKKEMFRL